MPARSRFRALALSLSIGLLTAVCLTGCVAEIDPPVKKCSPSYAAPTQFGRFTIQQLRRGASIQWGAYPNATYSGTHYLVKVYAGGVKVDAKSQNYAPHGSLSAARALKYSGKEFEVTGTITRGSDVTLNFTMACTIA